MRAAICLPIKALGGAFQFTFQIRKGFFSPGRTHQAVYTGTRWMRRRSYCRFYFLLHPHLLPLSTMCPATSRTLYLYAHRLDFPGLAIPERKLCHMKLPLVHDMQLHQHAQAEFNGEAQE